MTTYSQAGVNIDKGDNSSSKAYAAAKRTFKGRQNKFGSAVLLDEGFTGLMDFGDFYLVKNCDGTGTKSLIAQKMQKYDTLGYDLLAMVINDLVCVGAEAVSITDTIDIHTVDENIISKLMAGLEKACLEENVIIAGGEIAELKGIVMPKTFAWNSDAVGIVEKDKYINCKNVKSGDLIIGLKSNSFHSNGYTLVRYILNEKFGENWHEAEYENGVTWGEVTLKPTKLYHRAILDLIGGYKETRKVEIKGIANITGAGIPGNLIRILEPNHLGAKLDNLIEPLPEMTKLMKIGKVSREEAYNTWNMGVGMVLVINAQDKNTVLEHFESKGIYAQIIGTVIKEEGIIF
jgi:phosphoribosylformylglycinamidine cyclo-ligase